MIHSEIPHGSYLGATLEATVLPVGQHVCFQIMGQREGLLTLCALEQPLAGVCNTVSLQFGWRIKDFEAYVTLVGFLYFLFRASVCTIMLI